MVDVTQIKALLDHYFVVKGSAVIDEHTGMVSISGSVGLKMSQLSVTRLPVKFHSVTGNFECHDNKLDLLVGAPREVGGHVYVSGVTSLEGGPIKVGGDFWCESSWLNSLKGAPRQVGGGFYLWDNLLDTLEGAPQSVDGDFDVANNPLTSLEGAPSKVGGVFIVDYTQTLPLLRTLVADVIFLKGSWPFTLKVSDLLNKHAGRGRRGAIQAAREMLELGEQLQQLQGLTHNPFERNARW
jgi:hypothetical protein